MANKLAKGDKIPSFRLKNQNDEWVDIDDHIGQSPLVIYFYPKDDTPGCTREACSFRDSFEDFEAHNARVFGISADSPRSHKRFAEKHRLNFTLLSDPVRTVEKLFGVPRSILGLLPGRVTYVVDKSGSIQHVFNSQLNADKHVREAIRVIKSM